MRKIDSLLEEYGSSHKNSTNKLIHWFCVPAIVFSLLGLFWSIQFDVFKEYFPSSISNFSNFAMVFALFAMVYYVLHSVALALGMLLVITPMLFALHLIDLHFSTPLWLISLIIFTVAWIFQFYGHKIEGKKPSFLRDVQLLLIGPTWLLHFIYQKIGIKY
jgi:uncharacterized membrane protein YGL010W